MILTSRFKGDIISAMKKTNKAILKIKNLFKSDFDEEIEESAQQIAILNIADEYGVQIDKAEREEIIKQASLLQIKSAINDFAKTKFYRGKIFVATAAVAAAAIATALSLTNIAPAGVICGTFAAFLPGSALAGKYFFDGQELKKQRKDFDHEHSQFIAKHYNDSDELYMATARLLDAKNQYLQNLENAEKIFDEVPDTTLVEESRNLLDYCEEISNYVYEKEEREL